ncbi:response regulator [Clostridium coskatii]|uniref:Stage 0 sporulation protein A homolog n=1 Tax=Clostridium coskatii TaxID=1705578 RepID=A0A168NX52_9CLOT|nr:response regulator [Clostridium coskatii]OAA87027.1 Transcriptional regulatory protein YpdB [Clostridium coskatii]OBR97790.1 transcriptional regulatory protein YpdB [Clostridium coskatii]
MKVILVDDDKAMILILKRILNKIEGVEIVNTFDSSRDVLEFIKNCNIDMIFLDINIPGENGVGLARKILETSPSTDIVFITSYREYAVEAFDICAFDYIVKPILAERLQRTIRRAFEKRELLTEKASVKEKNISVYLFGGIDVNSKSLGTVKWLSSKSRELFVYLLVKEGWNISKNIIIEDIFQGMPLKNAENYLKTAVYQLRKALQPHDSNSLLISSNGTYKLECSDFYVDFMYFREKIKKFNKIDSSNLQEALAVEKIYVGDLLGDMVYYWSIAEREKYLNHYFNLLEKLGKYYFNNGDMVQASYILKKLIKINPLREEPNCILMNIFAVQKDKKSLMKHYESYVRMLKRELDICPEAAMTDLYGKLINSFNN